MKISSSQASLFKNKQQQPPIQYIPNGITLHTRAQSNNSLENFNSYTPHRISQNHQTQQPSSKPSANVFPHQKMQSLLKNSNQQQQQQQQQQMQMNSKSARNSPSRVISSQRGVNQPGVTRTPTSSVQQDYSSFMSQNYSVCQGLPQMNYSSIQNNQNNSTNQSQTKMNILKYVGGQYNSNSREQQPQQQSQQSSQSHQTLQRVASMQNYIKVGSIVNERDAPYATRNSVIPSQIGNMQFYDNHQAISQPHNVKKSMPPIQISTYNSNQFQPEILTPIINNNQPSFQNIDEIENVKCTAKRDECDFIVSPKISPKSYSNNSQSFVSPPNHGILQLQNITNNLSQIQRNSVSASVPKSRALSSIQFQISIDNQENYGKQESTNYSNDGLNLNQYKKGSIQLQTYQTNKTCVQNTDILNSQIQLEQLMYEAREQLPNNLQQQQNQIEQQKCNPNQRFESFMINDSLNMFQIASSTNNCQTSQFNNLQQDPVIPNNIHMSVFNSEFLPNHASVNLSNNLSNINSETKPNNNLNLVQFQKHQQKRSHSPESSHESKIEGDQTDRSCDINEAPKRQQQSREERSQTSQQNNGSKDNYELSIVEMKNDTMNSHQMSEREAYKQKVLQFQEENDRLQGIIKNLNVKVDEQTKLKQEAEQKIIYTEQTIQDIEKNAEKLLEENTEIKRQVEELNSIIDQQNEMENRYFLLEEKARFYEEELGLLRQQDKEKSKALANLQEHLHNDSEGDVNSVQLEEYISERVMQLLENQKCLKERNEQFQIEVEQKDQLIIQYEQDIQRLSEKINDYEDSKERLQQYVEERVQSELTQYYQKQQEQENQTYYQIEQLNQELIQTKQELMTQEEQKRTEFTILNNEIENYKQKVVELSYQPMKYDITKDISQSSANEKYLQQQVQDLEKQIQDLISLNNMYISQITELSNQHSKCYIQKTENETLKFQIDSFLFQVKDKESEIRQYQLKLEIKQNELNATQKSCENQLVQKTQEVMELQTLVQYYKDQHLLQNPNEQKPICQNDKCENPMQTALDAQIEQEKEQLLQENNELKGQLYNLENENRILKNDYQSIEQNQQILQQEVFDLRQYIENQQNYEEQEEEVVDEDSVELKREFEGQEDHNNESGVKNLDSLMHALSCQTIGTNYYQ